MTLFEGNLKKIVKLYLVVEVAYVAEPGASPAIETLEQISKVVDSLYAKILTLMAHAAIETLEQISKVVDSLYAKILTLMAHGVSFSFHPDCRNRVERRRHC
ncbi:hypothetical protein CVT25_002770 [Psilocybe cyanescens]|uniref:6S proteasome subunit Rpn6 C-terminal helix domain-containing protein n=1 Tax=Psilocybe cyanescens TaxID=93625 RepID=A0A409XBV5_PSICY|nr:hypothetical protein CVT25_002770 [Psilocybe cyanescens]